VSVTRVLIGLVLGSLVGSSSGRHRMGGASEYLADPWVTLFRFTPALALLPLYVIWFGTARSPRSS